MGKMRYTGKCHHKGCKKYIDESMARLVATYWYYCEEHARQRVVKKNINQLLT